MPLVKKEGGGKSRREKRKERIKASVEGDLELVLEYGGKKKRKKMKRQRPRLTEGGRPSLWSPLGVALATKRKEKGGEDKWGEESTIFLSKTDWRRQLGPKRKNPRAKKGGRAPRDKKRIF